MKEIKTYKDPKYSKDYTMIKENIYKLGDDYYVSLAFIQEPEYGEGLNPSDISQYPIEDLLDKYMVYISDFYEELNITSKERCYLEFSSQKLEDIESLLEIVDKHVFNKKIQKNGKEYIVLCVE